MPLQNTTVSTSSGSTDFLPPWLSEHVPFEVESEYPKKCKRYAKAWSKNETDFPLEIDCGGAFVYETEEKIILNEVKINTKHYVRFLMF